MDTYADTHTSTPTHCAATTRDGAPCGAARLAGSPFCAFHDPAYARTIAEGRSRGGAAPRRRTRRLPRRLDYLQVADLLSELFVDALNHANPADPRSLRAVCQVGRLLLQAVGRPKDSSVPPAEDAEPEADAPHLLRVYPTLPTELLAATEVPAPSRPRSGSAASTSGTIPSFPGHRDYLFRPDQAGEQWPEPTAHWFDTLPVETPETEEAAQEAALARTQEERWEAAPEEDAAVREEAAPVATELAALPLNAASEGSPTEAQAGMPATVVGAALLGALPGTEHGADKELDTEWTGSLATNNVFTADPVPVAAPPPPAHPGWVLPRSLAYIRRPPRDPCDPFG